MASQLVWFKRDLRVADHWPLARAAEAGPVHCVYVREPKLRARPDWDPRHGAFIEDCLAALDRGLRQRGAWLDVVDGDVLAVFDRLHERLRFDTIWAHQETGTLWTFARDRVVAAWARQRGVRFVEVAQQGVMRPHPRRDGWAGRWQRFMSRPCAPVPDRLVPAVAGPVEPVVERAGRRGPWALEGGVQPGGEDLAHDLLDSFVEDRVQPYRWAISRPTAGAVHGSRLSAHLAWGSISLRTVVQVTARAHERVTQALRSARGRGAGRARDLEALAASFDSFQARLRWRDHFTQKLEDFPAYERDDVNPAYAGLRSREGEAGRLAVWAEGRTGYPMVDACMRQLDHTGWLNFRMRAMLVSFACYDLWLDWRPVSEVLARRFVDYDPGIHYPQHQMQAGTTGINSTRMYNPTKQAREHDPDGAFIKRWVPELAGVPSRHLATPWVMTASEQSRAGVVVGVDYPKPVVHHGAAIRRARAALAQVRGRPDERAAAGRVFERHGSRLPPHKRRWDRRRSRRSGAGQLGLPFSGEGH